MPVIKDAFLNKDGIVPEDKQELFREQLDRSLKVSTVSALSKR